MRKLTLRENRFGAYLQYAVGEIVLVVIGILFALSINNWNHSRIENERTRQALSSMVTDLKEDIVFLEVHEQFYSNQIEIARLILLDSIPPQYTTDSIYLNLLLWTISLQDNSQSFQQIKSAEGASPFVSRSLDSLITNYYVVQHHFADGLMQWDVNETEQLNDFWNNALQIELANPFMQDIKVPYSQDESTRRAEMMRVLHSIEGRKELRNSIYHKKTIINLLNTRRGTAEQLIEEITKVL